MKPTELKKLIKTMRENGVLKLKTEGIELELAPESLFPNKRVPDTMPLSSIKTQKQYTDEQILMWSSRLPEEPEDDEEALEN